MSSINVQGISKKFGEQLAVNNVSFNVEAGEIFGLLGPKDRKSTRLNSSH